MSRSAEQGSSLVLIGDVHLDHDDPALDDFLAFLERLAHSRPRVVLMGDLFNIWVGMRDLEGDHQRAVVRKFRWMREQGCVVSYLEGNRDYRVASCHLGSTLDRCEPDGLVERVGGHSLYLAHGDLANSRDRQYRTWRRLSRSRWIWNVFARLPLARRQRIVDGLERRLRGTNLEFKQAIPEAMLREYARQFIVQGHDIVALGHFHEERDLRVDADGRGGRVLVLPEWKGSRRHLEVRPDGEAEFVDSTY